MYVLLSGGKANAGDFLITERARALLRMLRPNHAVEVLPAWQPLDPDSSLLRQADAIVIAGGPGYRSHMVPGVYPLCPRLSDLPCPVIPLGLGIKARAADPGTLSRYRFDAQSHAALRWMADHAPGLGCRDRPTQSVLKAQGFASARLVGCPVWYDVESLDKPTRLPARVRRLVFTPAQEHALAEQSIALGTGLARLFPDAERTCSFHRGLADASDAIPKGDVINNQRIASALQREGYGVVDVSGDAAKLSFYRDCDLHVGYRVHAHIFFLSQRSPSLLLHEDARGAGVSSTLDVQGIDAYVPMIPPATLSALPLAPPARVQELLGRQLPNPFAVPLALRTLEQDAETGFARFAGLSQVIDRHFEQMRDFISRFPGA